MRISIVGLPGSGKSTLARMLSKKFDIPHIHLDQYWFEAGGREGSKTTPPEEMERIRTYIREKIFPQLEQGYWVSDGFYPRIQEEIAKRADTILLLDAPLWRRLLNHAERVFKPSTRHNALTVWDDIRFFPEIVRRTYANKHKYEELRAEHPEKIRVLRSRRAVREYIESLSSAPPQ